MKKWLERLPPDTGRSLAVARYAEKVGWSKSGVAVTMARLLADGTASPELADRLVREAGWSRQRVWDALVAKRQPAMERQQGGKFGEVLHAAILEEFDGMTVLVRRYRYTTAPDAPLHGLDIVALGRVGDKDDGAERIVFAETKLRNVGGSSALIEAYDQIDKIGAEILPSRLAADMELLMGSNTGVLERLLQAIRRADPVHFRIGAIFESSAWSDSHMDGIDRKHAGSDLDVAVDVVTIGMLGDLVRESYLRVGALA